MSEDLNSSAGSAIFGGLRCRDASIKAWSERRKERCEEERWLVGECGVR
jgi:hypothetical protein